MNYEAERAMNQKRLRMEGEPGHGVVQGNGLPLNYMDNGHQIPYQPYAGAYNTHYPPPDAFAAYGPPPPGGYAPQNLSYAPPAHQNYPHHQAFPPQQPPQAQLHMPQTHMVQGYGDVAMHKPAWPPQPHLLPPLDPQKPLDTKHKPEIKLEPTDPQKRSHPEEMMQGDLDQPKIKIKTDIFKPDDLHNQHRNDNDKPHEATHKPAEMPQPSLDNKDAIKPDEKVDPSRPVDPSAPQVEKTEGDIKRESFSSPDRSSTGSTPGKPALPGFEPKKRGRPKGSTNKPKPAIGPGSPRPAPPAAAARAPAPPSARGPRAPYHFAVKPFRKDFSGIQFRRRWSDDCLDSSHIPNEVYFGDVPVSNEILFNYYDANAEREKLAAQAAHIAAQKAAAAKLAAAKIAARGGVGEVTTVDSSSDDDSSGSSGSDSSDDDDTPLKRGPGRPKGTPSKEKRTGTGGGRRGRPPVPPELRPPGVTDMKKFCAAAGLRIDYKKLTDGCTKNKERVAKMLDLLIAAGLEGKPTLEKCKALKAARQSKKDEGKKKKQAKAKEVAEGEEAEEAQESSVPRRMTRGATGVKPRQKIVISSDEEDGTPSACRNLSKLRSMVDDSESD